MVGHEGTLLDIGGHCLFMKRLLFPSGMSLCPMSPNVLPNVRVHVLFVSVSVSVSVSLPCPCPLMLDIGGQKIAFSLRNVPVSNVPQCPPKCPCPCPEALLDIGGHCLFMKRLLFPSGMSLCPMSPNVLPNVPVHVLAFPLVSAVSVSVSVSVSLSVYVRLRLRLRLRVIVCHTTRQARRPARHRHRHRHNAEAEPVRLTKREPTSHLHLH